MKKRTTSNVDYVLETLRIEKTNLTQEDFVKHCGIAIATYQRWVYKNQEPKLTPSQLKKICSLCKISPKKFLDYFQ